MAALAFPASPSVNDIFTSGSRSWRWTGARWAVISAQVPLSRLSIEDAVTGDTLVFDGNEWSPVPLSEGSTPTIARAAWDNPYHYYGHAPTGTAESASGWTIKRLEASADGLIVATASATGAWSSRSSLSYS